MNVMQTLAQTTAALRTISQQSRQLAGTMHIVPGTVDLAGRMSSALKDASAGVALLNQVNFTGEHADALRTIMRSARNAMPQMSADAYAALTLTSKGMRPYAPALNVARSAEAWANALAVARELLYRP